MPSSALSLHHGPCLLPGAAFAGQRWLSPELALCPALAASGQFPLCVGDGAPSSLPSPALPWQPFPGSCPHSLPAPQEGDHRWINPVARALQLLNSLYGPFGKTHGIGRCAKVGMARGPIGVRLAGTWAPSATGQHSSTEVTLPVPPPGRFWGSRVPGWAAQGRLLLAGCGGAPVPRGWGCLCLASAFSCAVCPGPGWEPGLSPALAPSAPHR